MNFMKDKPLIEKWNDSYLGGDSLIMEEIEQDLKKLFDKIQYHYNHLTQNINNQSKIRKVCNYCRKRKIGEIEAQLELRSKILGKSSSKLS